MIQREALERLGVHEQRARRMRRLSDIDLEEKSGRNANESRWTSG